MAIEDSERIFEGFENLMPFRVQDILLVSSLYDSFILREDGRLSELLISQSLELHLQHTPEITHVATAAEALALARTQPRYNLIITNVHVADMDCLKLAAELRSLGLDIPVAVLAFDPQEVSWLEARRGNARDDGIEQVFLWQGDPRLLLAIVKSIEDGRNVAADAERAAIPVVLLVEDDVRYYSILLPEIYTALITQSRRVLSDGYNLAHKLLRMRARPKILLAQNYETARAIVERYRPYLFGVVSDVGFPRGGKLDDEAGFDLARLVRREIPDIPIVLQSSEAELQSRAHAEGFAFQKKASETLLADMRQLLTQQFAFGDFVFRMADGREVGRAGDLDQMEQQLRRVPEASLIYHGERNDISHWLIARTELALAEKLRPRRVKEYKDSETLRMQLVETIADYRRQQKELLVGDFQPQHFQPAGGYFLRLGNGSLGGKARGLAFVRHLLHRYDVGRRFGGVRVAVPNTLVVATDWFEAFLAENGLSDFAIRATDDEELTSRFLAAALPRALRAALADFLRQVRVPLAVRSSSLLEDSQYQPFTGVYDTFMLANRAAELDERLEELSEAIKRVYASTYLQHAKNYIRATPFRLEEEKMAVLVQEIVGAEHDGRFYPDFSGVLRSRNFYPAEPMQPEDGVAIVALGLGRTVVDGGKALAFCPRYPQNMIQFSAVEDILRNAQTEFMALDLREETKAEKKPSGAFPAPPPAPFGGHTAPLAKVRAAERLREKAFPLREAERDGTLSWVASTYVRDNHAIYDGMSRAGARVVTFAPILKYELFPLAVVLDSLQKLGAEALGRPVEIEFAVRMGKSGEEAEFGFLQMRPLTVASETEEGALETVVPERVLCRSRRVLGDGRIEGVRDIVVVDRESFHRANSVEVAEIVARMNARLVAEATPYVLVGVGRWGSKDPWLGIPVTWDQVSGARVIVEAGFRDMKVTPSQGSHFFQNLTAFRVAYFTVNPEDGEIDWEWMAAHPAVEEQGPVRHLRLAEPVRVLVSGAKGWGVVERGSDSLSGK